MTSRPIICRAFALAALLTACTGWTTSGWGQDPPAPVVDWRVLPERAALAGPDDRIQIVVTTAGDDADHTEAATIAVEPPEVAQVDDRGRLIPLADGSALVSVTWQGIRKEIPVEVSGMSESAPPSFRRHVIPILNRSGCSAGACHAAQYGQGGFKLSLLGYAPEQDYPQMVRDHLQRRVALVQPEDSLLLLKPTLGVPHGGGRRMEEKSYEYQTLQRWIASGVPAPVEEPAIINLEVWPEARRYTVDESQQLRVIAVTEDGQRRDVTHLAMYDSLDPARAEVDARGRIRALGPGQAAVMVRFLGQAKVSRVITPYAESVDLSGFEPVNFIDYRMMELWQELGVEPSAGCTDAEFMRRAYLDATGTLPTPEAVRAFQQSADPSKRERLVDELLGLTGDPERDVHEDAWSAWWTLKWGDLIRNNRNDLGDGGMWALHNWIRNSLRDNMPVDEFVRRLITAQGSVFQSGPANYYKITNKPDELAETTAQVFLGVRLQCARCHHHPFEVYSQADYYGLAAFFTRVATKTSTDFGSLGGDTVVMVRRDGSIRHPRTRAVMAPTPLGGEPVVADEFRDLRQPLADWLTAPANDLFARNIVNRFWGYFMGTGIVEPIDDQRATNPPSNPALLDELAADFAANGYDLKQLMRTIMLSRTYQLSSLPPSGPGAANPQLFLSYRVKRMPAEALLDAICFVTEAPEKFPGIPAGTRAIELPDPNYTSYFLDTLGRPPRVIACECERTAQPNLAQVLHLANGDLLSRKIAADNGRIARLMSEEPERSDTDIITELYLCTFSREPEPEEIASCLEILSAAPSRREGLEDILWALCNSAEFLFNH